MEVRDAPPAPRMRRVAQLAHSRRRGRARRRGRESRRQVDRPGRPYRQAPRRGDAGSNGARARSTDVGASWSSIVATPPSAARRADKASSSVRSDHDQRRLRSRRLVPQLLVRSPADDARLDAHGITHLSLRPGERLACHGAHGLVELSEITFGHLEDVPDDQVRGPAAGDGVEEMSGRDQHQRPPGPSMRAACRAASNPSRVSSMPHTMPRNGEAVIPHLPRRFPWR